MVNELKVLNKKVLTWLLIGGGEETARAPGDALLSSTRPLERSLPRGERLGLERARGDRLERASGEAERAAGDECLRFLPGEFSN